MRRNSGIIGEHLLVTPDKPENCKVSDLHDAYVNKAAKTWPKPIQLTVNTVASSTITEGGQATFQIRDPYFTSGTVYWTVNFNGSTNSSDFAATSGSVTLSAGNSTIFVETVVNDPNEGTETFYLDYRTGSTSGPVFASSPVVSVTNALLPTAYGPLPKTTQSPGTTNWQSGQFSSSSAAYTFGQYPSNIVTGDVCRLVFAYRTSTFWRGDLQLDDLYYNTTSVTSGGSNLNIDSTSSSLCPEQSTTLTTYSSSTFPNATDITTKYNNETFQNVTAGASRSWWNMDSSGTPSSATGLTNVGSGQYCYYESSSPGYSYKMRLLRTKPFTVNKPSNSYGFRLRVGAYGSHIGLLKIFIVK